MEKMNGILLPEKLKSLSKSKNIYVSNFLQKGQTFQSTSSKNIPKSN